MDLYLLSCDSFLARFSFSCLNLYNLYIFRKNRYLDITCRLSISFPIIPDQIHFLAINLSQILRYLGGSFCLSQISLFFMRYHDLWIQFLIIILHFMKIVQLCRGFLQRSLLYFFYFFNFIILVLFYPICLLNPSPIHMLLNEIIIR